jgi:Domain of unknown function (DUF4384)
MAPFNLLSSICLGLVLVSAGSPQVHAHRETAPPSAVAQSPQALFRQAPRAQKRFAQASPAAPAKFPNPAKVSVEMIPASSVDVGSKVAFQVTAAKRGYVLLVDVDATGKMSQIFPNPELLARFNDPDLNLIKPGGQLTIPSETARKSGFDYVATPPAGPAVIVAIFSDRRVQLLDLPELPEGQASQSEMLGRLEKWIDELRVADPDSGKLLPNGWSFDIKTYVIH